MAFDLDNIAGLRRGAFFGAALGNSSIDFLQDSYVWNVADPLTFDCTDPLPPHETIHKAAAWSPPGVTPRSLSLRDDTVWIDSAAPTENPAVEGLPGETFAEYVARVGTPDWIIVTGGGQVNYIGYDADCDTTVDPGFPAFGVELDGAGVSFGSGERGILALGSGAEGVHGQGGLDIAVAKAVADYAGDPTNDATLCLFTYPNVDTGVFYFETGYVAHSLQSLFGTGFSFGVRAYWQITPGDGSQLMCVL